MPLSREGRRYLSVTIFVADPPRLEVTVTVPGLTTGVIRSSYLPFLKVIGIQRSPVSRRS